MPGAPTFSIEASPTNKKGQYDKAAKDFKAAIRLKVVFAGTFLFWGTVIPDQSAPLATASRCSVRMESKR